MTCRLPSIGALLLGALLTVSFVAPPPLAEAQSSARTRRARLRRAQARRARLRDRRRRRAARVRARRARILARSTDGHGAQDAADMEFALPAEVDEVPPPMADNFVEEVEARQEAARVARLDPELREDRSPSAPTITPRGHHSPLTAHWMLGGVHRSLGYHGYERGELTPYTLPFGATVGLGADYFPAAHVTDDGWAHLGFHWRFEHSVGIGSTGPNDVSYPTTYFVFELGARYRVPLDDLGSQIAFAVDVGQHRFAVERGSLENPAPRGIPAATYTQLRLGVSGRWAIGDLGVGGRLDYTPVFDAGEMAATLGGAETHGFGGALRADYGLGLGFAVLVEVDARLYVSGFSPEADARVRAEGALDTYVGARLGVEWRMPAMSAL